MKINKYNSLSSVNNSKPLNREAGKEVSKGQAKEAVQVSFSEEAQALMKADKAAFSERVDTIKQAIQNGDYEVDATKISQGLIKALKEQKES
ncbi:flagellar biosynthesis anti-sigma factor FlgM [Alkalibacterium sp. MB6]|uniref:flagellar biosynthesis anti-sigma factor FlgM n=1 Tax=Alkalibacterium sp. MB6 TaxID=2081965 RepID=UPI00137B8A83|nr:flagellar biosynthesis anti-sigma factor FlgM [Alkalibacterium sp. MB6]